MAFLNSTNIIVYLGDSLFTLPILSICLFSLIEFITNKFKFSENKQFKFIQIISFIILTLLLIIIFDFLYSKISLLQSAVESDIAKDTAANSSNIANASNASNASSSNINKFWSNGDNSIDKQISDLYSGVLDTFNIKELIYKNWKDPILSSSIDTKSYKDLYDFDVESLLKTVTVSEIINKSKDNDYLDTYDLQFL